MANLVGQGPTAAPFATSEYVGTSVADPRLGTRWKDNDGNEYMIVDFQQALVAGEWVSIDVANLATRLTTASHGKVGIVCGSPTTSDTKGYVQIYGLYAGAAGTSTVATSNFLTPNDSWCDIGVVAALPSSSAGGAVQVYNAFAFTAPDSATTSPASSFVTAAGTSSTAIGFSVWLAYPYVVNAVNAGGTT
jgi:hypothetical protein